MSLRNSLKTMGGFPLINVILTLLFFSPAIAQAQCGFAPGLGCALTDYTNYGINSSNPVTLEYDNFLSGFHSTVIRDSEGKFFIWGENASYDGVAPLLVPTEINSTNFPGMTGIPLKVTMGSLAVDHQKILLTTDGLFAWGTVGAVLSSGIKNTTYFEKIQIAGKADGLPEGVNPSDIKMMFASTKILSIVTCDGFVYMLSLNRAQNQGDGLSQHVNSWAKVKTDKAGHPDLSHVVAVRGSTNTLMALTSDNELYTWGFKTLLGDGSIYNPSGRNYATKMTLPENSQIKMIGVTSYDRNHDKKTDGTDTDNPTYYILYSNKKIYSMGSNELLQLGDFTTVSKNYWVQPHYPQGFVTDNPNPGAVMDDVIWISATGHDIRWPGIDVINEHFKLWNWGSNAGSMLGRSSISQDNNDNTPFNPGQPRAHDNFDPQTSKILTVESGGHTTLIIQQCEENFGYVGHAIHGSTAAGFDGDEHYPDFIFNTSKVDVCGVQAVPEISFVGNPTTTTGGDMVCKDQKIELVGDPVGGIFSVVSGPGEITNGTLLSFTGDDNQGTIRVRYTVEVSTCQNKYVDRIVEFGPCAAQTISGNVWIDNNNNALIEPDESGTNAASADYSGLWANLILEGTANPDSQEQGCQEPDVTGTTFTTVKDGLWSDASIWFAGKVPKNNLGNNNKIIIKNNVTQPNDLNPVSNSVIVIKDGGSLTTNKLEIKNNNVRLIINYGSLHLTNGDLTLENYTTSGICTFHACILLDKGQINFKKQGADVDMKHTSIHQLQQDLVSNANVSGTDIRIWLENGMLKRQSGNWPGNTIFFWRAKDGAQGFDSELPLQSSLLEIDLKMNACQTDFCNSDKIGEILATTPVSADGHYLLVVPEGCIYKVQISAYQLPKGLHLLPGDNTLPAGWFYTGNNVANEEICMMPDCTFPNLISGILVQNENVTGINFGIKGKFMISGTVFQDANGLNNHAVDGHLVYGQNTDYQHSDYPQLYIQLINDDGIIIDQKPVGDDGTYRFTEITDKSLHLQLTTTYTETGQSAAAPSLYAQWYFAGENFGTHNKAGNGVNDGTGTGVNAPDTRNDGKIDVVFKEDGSAITHVDFGIELPPVADPKDFENVAPGEFTVPSEASVPGFPKVDSYQYIRMTHSELGPLTGSDPEDCPLAQTCSMGRTFSIHSVNEHTKLFYDFGGSTGVKQILPENGVVEIPNFDPARMVIYGEIGYGTPDANFSFTYSLKDAAGISSAPVPYIITTTRILPLGLVKFEAIPKGNNVDLNWSFYTSDITGTTEIQWSADGKNWITIGSVKNNAEGISLRTLVSEKYTDNTPADGTNYYRIKQTGNDGTYYLSKIKTVTLDNLTLTVFPNPATTTLGIRGINGAVKISVYDYLGRMIRNDKTDKKTYNMDISQLRRGNYNLIILDKYGRTNVFTFRKE